VRLSRHSTGPRYGTCSSRFYSHRSIDCRNSGKISEPSHNTK
jgi:hypothetical protein